MRPRLYISMCIYIYKWFINSPNQGDFFFELARISSCHSIDFIEMMKHTHIYININININIYINIYKYKYKYT